MIEYSHISTTADLKFYKYFYHYKCHSQITPITYDQTILVIISLTNRLHLKSTRQIIL